MASQPFAVVPLSANVDEPSVPPDTGDPSCPTAVIEVEEGSVVLPQTTLHLDGSASTAVEGEEVVAWEWSLSQPAGATATFDPGPDAVEPVLTLDVAGTYLVTLKVWDSAGLESCEVAESQIVVQPDGALHVELLWDTPGDPDPTDVGSGAGADLDLHFAHPQALGNDVDEDGVVEPWFDLPWDCFWYNDHPNWGSFNPDLADDPGLDLDDVDGAGPENLNLEIAEPSACYRMGAHYADDHGYGPSFATLRVYIYGALVTEIPGVELVAGDMWFAATVCWPEGLVTVQETPEGGWDVIPDYSNPLGL